MNRSKKIFLISSLLFTVVAIGFSLDMCSRTTPPWERKKESLKKYKVKETIRTKEQSSH